MTSIWVESIGLGSERALDLLAAAVRECPDDRWEARMWEVAPLGPNDRFLDEAWEEITDEARHQVLADAWVQRRSTPWSVAWHALECLDYDLNGEFGPWSPPQPFAQHPHWRDLASLPTAWMRTEVLGYIQHCRGQARGVLASISEESAARPMPETHRYAGQPYAGIILGAITHTIEHAAQIRQFSAPV